MTAATGATTEEVITTTDHLAILKKSISSVLSDKGFSIASDRAQKALTCAQRMSDWISQPGNQEQALDFATKIVPLILQTMSLSSVSDPHLHRERMWELYYKLCSCDSFRSMWQKFIQVTVGLEADPIFYQYVTKSIMEDLIKSSFQIKAQVCSDNAIEQVDEAETPRSLDYEEQNALRYIEGYIIRSVSQQIKRSSHKQKEELLLCLRELMSVNDPDQEEAVFQSEDWSFIIDRGGLIHVSDTTHVLFVAMEVEMRKRITDLDLSSNFKDMAIESIMHNREFLLCWREIAINWGNESDELKEMIVRQYVTVRGFSAAGAFIEKYKQNHQKTVQKKRALRKTLH